MGLFTSEAEKQRKVSLTVLENKRVRFALRLKEMRLYPETAIYAQSNGGFHGIAICSGVPVYITAPGPGQDEDFTVTDIQNANIKLEDVYIASKGAGGIWGLGQKAVLGFSLNISLDDTIIGDVEILSGQNCIFEYKKGKDPVFDTARRAKYSNVVWDFYPISFNDVPALKERWLNLLKNLL